MKLVALTVVAAAFLAQPGAAQRISNGVVEVRATRAGMGFSGFEVAKGTRSVASVLLSSEGLISAARCRAVGAREVRFDRLFARMGCGLTLGSSDSVTVSLPGRDPYPTVRFDLHVAGFDASKWSRSVGKEPFHFLAIELDNAEAWHQRGWLNATPFVDPFPLLGDTHVGTPEISGYHYNRNWSYTPPLGAHPLPVIGLWAPATRRYVGFEFETTRLQDNSERDIATGYRWTPAAGGGKARQIVALVYPYGGVGYQTLVLPKKGDRIASHCRLLWSLDLPATDDPNRLFYADMWARLRSRLPAVPPVVDLSWAPGGIRLREFGGPAQGMLIGGVEGGFQVPGSRLIEGWGWHNEGPIVRTRGAEGSGQLTQTAGQADELLRYAKHFQVGGDDCVYWEKPLEGQWTPEWGGKGVTTLHNANGFAAGRLFLALYRDAGKSEYLPIVDGVFNWAKHVAWTRNEFADVPSSPFAIGGTLSASFCLDYYMAFRDAPDQAHRDRAKLALNLARSFTYRYLTMWPSDSNRHDNVDPTFLWEPNSGRDWTGAACANEVFWNLDTLAQTAVHTGDPVLMWALQGSLNRWHLLYQERYKRSLADYQPADMAEGYGLYAGNVYGGVGARSQYGFASPLFMTEPVGETKVRVLAGERAAMAFDKDGTNTSISGYRYSHPGNLSFTVRTSLPTVGLSLTVPYVDITGKPVAIVRGGNTIRLEEGAGVRHQMSVHWSLIVDDVRDGDRVVVGYGASAGPALPSGAASVGARAVAAGASVAHPIRFARDVRPSESWDDLAAYPGRPTGLFWAFGVPFDVAAAGTPAATATNTALPSPIRNAVSVALLYSLSDGPAPSVVFSDGTAGPADHALESIAWRAWPPIYTARLLVSLVPTQGKTIAGIDPGGRELWAATALHGVESAAVRAALRVGAVQWAATQQEERSAKTLSAAGDVVQAGSIAVLPPAPAGAVWNLMARAMLTEKTAAMSPDQVVDPGVFSAQRFKVAVYGGGEDYVDTVREAGDASSAVIRYLKEGGTLVLVSQQPWPMYYGSGPNARRAEPLTGRLGLPLQMAVEAMPTEKLTLVAGPGAAMLGKVAARFPYPQGDARLRSIDRRALPEGTKYTPIYTVKGASGKDYGDAAGLIEFAGGGRILYVASLMFNDPVNSPPIAEGVVRLIMKMAGG